MAKIIPLYTVEKVSTLPLSRLMIKTLRAAFEMQQNHKPFGQVNLNGSFMALLKRQYIDCNIKGKQEVIWFVTKAGIKALHEQINEPC